MYPKIRLDLDIIFPKKIIIPKKNIENTSITPAGKGQWGPIMIKGFPFSSAKKVCVFPNFE